eukprot:1073525-Prorocentrum_minimum.AAC.1
MRTSSATRNPQMSSLGTARCPVTDPTTEREPFSVLSSQFSVLSSRFSVLGSRFSVLGSQFSILGS